MQFQFNEGQKRVIDAGLQHLFSSGGDPVFEYSGKAGTGKSVVMNEIWRLSGLSYLQIAPMAYVGQAAIIMRLKGFPNARTIHSWIYHPEIQFRDEQDSMNDYLGTSNTKLEFIPRSIGDFSDIKAIFIDEGATVPISMKKDLIDLGKRIIVAGDINQLPPVNSTPAFLYDPSRVHFLTEVMRQKQGSGILHIAEEKLAGKDIPNGFYYDAMVIYEDELNAETLKQADMVLCATNRTRDKYNKLIREDILGIKSDLPVYGDKVICRKNDWSIEINGIGLGNGIIGTVANMPEVASFRDTNKRNCFYMDFQPDLFPGIFFDLDVNFDYLNADYNGKKALKNNPYTQGHLFDYAYCNTVHLTQGAQYPFVVYIEENVFEPELQARLNYTACTRATRSLIYVKRRKKRRQFFIQ